MIRDKFAEQRKGGMTVEVIQKRAAIDKSFRELDEDILTLQVILARQAKQRKKASDTKELLLLLLLMFVCLFV